MVDLDLALDQRLQALDRAQLAQPAVDQPPLGLLVVGPQHAQRLEHGAVALAQLLARTAFETRPLDPHPAALHVVTQTFGVARQPVCVELQLDPSHEPSVVPRPVTTQDAGGAETVT